MRSVDEIFVGVVFRRDRPRSFVGNGVGDHETVDVIAELEFVFIPGS